MDLAHGSKLFCRWLFRFFLIAASVAAFPALCFAAHKRRKFHFDLFAEGGGSFYQATQDDMAFGALVTSLGSAVVIGDAVSTLDPSGRLSVGGDFWFTRHDAVQASYSYARADFSVTAVTLFTSTPPAPPPVSYSSPLGAHFLSFDYLRSLRVSRKLDLLLSAGLGRVWWAAPLDSQGLFSANLGTGLSYGLSRHWVVRAEYRDYLERFPGPDGTMVNNHAPTVGLVYRF